MHQYSQHRDNNNLADLAKTSPGLADAVFEREACEDRRPQGWPYLEDATEEQGINAWQWIKNHDAEEVARHLLQGDGLRGDLQEAQTRKHELEARRRRRGRQLGAP